MVNTNDVDASQSKSLYPAPYSFGGPEGKGHESMGIATEIANDTSINQLAGPHSILTAAVVNTNHVDASQKSDSPYPYFPFEGLRKGLQ